jgi:cysteinyl-tRNA synthetase
LSRQIKVRSEVRKQKLWTLSDQIHGKLKELGVTIEDSKDGTIGAGTWS